jgi:bifunctional DNA-binding transcriptional regulator/antitoxin component of YhaV-PrlF toxin-antitoxin module
MPIKYTVTLTALGTSSVIVLPKPIIDGFNLGRGRKLDMFVRDDGIYIPLNEKPAHNDDPESSTDSHNQEQ